VRELEAGLAHWAQLLERYTGVDVRALPGGGAAGGLPAGLAAALGARLRSAFDEVAREVWLPKRLARCDLCLTGEGRIDEQTAGGKVVAGVARLAAVHGVPTLAFTGALRLRTGQSAADLETALGIERIVVVTPPQTATELALASTAANLRRAARETLAVRT
jgi:glycerate kinase